MHDLKFKAVGSLAVPSNDGAPLTAAHEYQLQLAGAIIERSGIPDNWIVRYERACNRDRAPWLEVTFSPPKFLLRNDTGADAQNLTEEILSIVIGRYSLNTEHAVIMAGANDSRIVLRTPGHIYRLEPSGGTLPPLRVVNYWLA